MNAAKSKILKAQYKALISEEERFAARVVYLMRATRDHPWWHLLIPFKFLFEYLARKKETRKFTEQHMRFKMIALDGAYMCAETGEENQSRQKMQSQFRDFWLHELKMESGRVYELLSDLLEKMFDHYLLLFNTGEKNHAAMAIKAYSQLDDYRQFLQELDRLENEINEQLHQDLTDGDVGQETHKRQKAVRKVRERYLREIF
ncbi:NF038143 family protein [Desulfonatronovibrio magnus]|uniref:NF038143 family protein n=1 Tax=Desulfonatronovibrio magnus TaxID=698827 RepID=UPI0012FADAF2|nr:NF038143 family protein [Desulfonatronovibrio magnus]